MCHPTQLPEQGLRVVYDALVGMIVGVGEENVPVFGHSVWVDGEPVVLTGDEAAICPLVDAWLVVATVTVPEETGRQKYLGVIYSTITAISLISNA